MTVIHKTKKHDEQRISILKGIITSESQPKNRINFEHDGSTIKCEFPASIEIKTRGIYENAEPSIKSTSRGIMIDLRVEPKNACDSMRFSCESFLNEIDESDRQFEKHDEQRISTFRGIVIDVIGWRPKERRPMFATRTLAARERKKADDETMTSSLNAKPIRLLLRNTFYFNIFNSCIDFV
jgi:hypothetical protein